MSVLDRPRTEADQLSVLVEPVPAAPARELPRASGANGWFLFLGIPFVLGAFFVGLAIGLDTEWPLTPAFLFGPLLMIAAYIYLCLSSEANTE